MSEERLHLTRAGIIAAGLLTNRWKPATREHLAAALTHHDRILDDLARLLREGADIHRPSGRPVTFLERTDQPTRALLGLLDQHPRLSTTSDRAPSDVLTERPALGGPWRDLNRALLVSAHDWSRIGSPPPPDVRWGVVANVAAITRAVTVLHVDLAEAATQLKMPDVAHHLRSHLSGALHLISAAALERAEAGPTRDGWQPAAHRSLVDLVSELHGAIDKTEIPGAADALARVLHHPGLRLDAETTIALIRNHAATTQFVGRYLSQLHDATGTALIRHGDALTRVAGRLHNRVWSTPSPPAYRRPLAQAQQIQMVARSSFATNPPDITSHILATRYARTVLGITVQLSAHLRRATDLGQWMTINRDTSRPDLHWRPIRAQDFPDVLEGTRTALKAAAGLGPTHVPARPGVLDHPHSAHRVLAGPLARATTNPQPGRRPRRP
jgi:hypothetical protein